MNDSSPHPVGAFHCPGSFELFELMDRVISDWAFLPLQMAGIPAPGPAQLELEYGVRIQGACECVLVLRSNAELGAILAEASTGDPGAREQGPDAFRELCNLASSHILSSHYSGAREGFQPFLPEPSRPESWPGRTPDSQCVMICESHPIEARLWIGSGEAGRG